MCNVILLDIDDCLSTDASILVCADFDQESIPGYKIPRTGDRIAIGLINRACRICAAKIVVASSWLAVAGPQYTIDWLIKNGLRKEHLLALDSCVNYRPSSGSKLEAIDDWLFQNPKVPADRIVVIDDDVSLFPPGHPLADRQVIVDGEDGVMLRHYRAVIRKLGGSDREARVIGPWRFNPSAD